MVNALEVNPNELIQRTSEKLEDNEEITPPEWADYAKTGSHKERPPTQENWWYIRTAAILRSVYKRGPIGTEKLRSKYGGKKDRGMQPEKFRKGSGSVIRKALQQLEKAEYVEHGEKEGHKGRMITEKGKSFLDKTAADLIK